MKRYILAALAMLLFAGAPASAQYAPRHYLSAATNNATLVLGRAAVVGMVQATNTTAVVYYLKLYNKATAPTCGTDVPVLTVALPVAPGALPPIEPAAGMLFPLGVGMCITANAADNDNTAAVTGITVNIGVTGR